MSIPLNFTMILPCRQSAINTMCVKRSARSRLMRTSRGDALTYSLFASWHHRDHFFPAEELIIEMSPESPTQGQNILQKTALTPKKLTNYHKICFFRANQSVRPFASDFLAKTPRICVLHSFLCPSRDLKYFCNLELCWRYFEIFRQESELKLKYQTWSFSKINLIEIYN